jgi:outer membrane protein insertion porin family
MSLLAAPERASSSSLPSPHLKMQNACPAFGACFSAWLGGLLALFLLTLAPSAWAQLETKVAKINVEHRGPPAVSDELIRANIRVKVGDPYRPAAVDEDVRSLYATGFFYNLRVGETNTPEGIDLTYIVQGKPRLTEIKFHGNRKYSDAKLRKKITSKVGEPLDERKLFTDSQEIQKMYQKAGYPRTEIKAIPSIDEAAGRGTATFEIVESPKVKIVEVNFIGATAFKQSKLRKVVKTRKHWMFSWLTGHGFLKDDEFEEDRERLAEFYRDHGYIDFEIKDVQFVNPTPKSMVIRIIVYEGRQYRVGAIKFTGNKLFSTNDIANGLRNLHAAKGGKGKVGPNGLIMDVGDVFKPKDFAKDVEDVEDFYGAKGYIDVSTASRNLVVLRIPNTESGTMDIEFQIEEGQKSYVERVEIRGNTKTKDKVIRRELALAPGEVFDTVRMKVSKQRLEGLQYFEKVDARPEPSDVSPSRKDLVIGVDEKNTGNLTMGAGFSSVDSIVGFVEVSQGNFDLFHPPTFTGGGQKFRLRVQIGTERQDYIASFVEPWFLGRKLALGVELYHRDLNYQSVENLYDETHTGAHISLERALWGDFLRGSLSYTIEDKGIHVNATDEAAGKVPDDILKEKGHHLLSRVGASVAYDTRGPGPLPNRGQRSELVSEIVGGPLGGDEFFYSWQFKTAWYFRGLYPTHVLEFVGRTGVAQSLQSDDVPFYERFYLGGLYSLRGFKYRGISPRQEGLSEPIGGDTYWFGSLEYSIPIIERLRFALFYDIGAVQSQAYDFTSSQFSDNWGIGLRLNLPIGPLRLDYGIPIHHDEFNSGSGKFQFGVGYTREF